MSITLNASTSSGFVQSADNSGEIELQSNGTTALKVNTNEGIQILNCLGVGNSTPSTSGAGITFPATQSASSDANTLDDYEEGTWTPTWTRSGSNPSYTLSASDTAGRYTKVGNLVIVSFVFRTSAISSAGSGSWYISNLPFTSNSAVPQNFGSIGRIYNGAEITGLRMLMEFNTSYFIFKTVSTDSDYSAAPSGGIVILQGTMSYFV